MQQLTLDQASFISGGECGAARVANAVVVGFFVAAGGLIGGAISFGTGAVVGGSAGAIAGAAAWEGMRDETIAKLCE